MLCLYRDNCLLAGPQKELEEFLDKFTDRFAISGIESLKDKTITQFIGHEIYRDRETMTCKLTQLVLLAKGVKSIRNWATNYRSNLTPMYTTIDYVDDLDEPIHDHNYKTESRYMLVVGILGWLTSSRPDISFAYSVLARYTCHPTSKHWKWLKHVFHYLNRTKEVGLQLGGNPNPVTPLEIYCDANFAGNIDLKRSTSGLAVFFYGSLVYHQAEKQSRIASLTFEAEINACVNAWEQGGLRISRMMIGLTIEVPRPIPIFTDSLSIYTKLAGNNERYENKQYDITIKWLRELESFGEAKFNWIAG